MKRILSIILIALGATVGLASCVIRDDNYNVQPDNSYQYGFTDDFNSDVNRWSFRDNANGASVYLTNGMLHYDYHPSSTGTNTVAVSTGMPASVNSFDVQARLRSDNAMGLVIGVSPSDYGYSFFIDDRGYFALYDEGTSSVAAQPIINWTSSAAIRQGWNDIELQQTYNGSWIGYINGTQVFQIQARMLYGSQAGFIVLANTNGDADFLDIAW
jgi:hypothetical protein